MANTYVDYTATAGQTDFAFSFPYLEDSHVVVEVEGVDQTLTTNYTIETSPVQKIVLSSPTTAIAGGELVRIKRVSDPSTNLVDFVNGSVLTETELDRAYLHNRYLSEEAYDGVNAGLGEVEGSTNYNANNKQIKNLADGTLATDAVNKGYVDGQVALTNTNLAGFFKSTHTGNAVDNVFTLSFTPQTTEAEAYIVSIDGLVQVPDTDYTIGATDITFNTIPANSAEICVVATAASSVATVNEAQVTATGSTAARSLANRFTDVVNVLDYGVKNDGTEPSGDSNAVRIQAIIDGLSARNSTTSYTGGGTVFFPSGKYTVDDTIYVNSGIRLLGTLASPSFAFDPTTAAGSKKQGTQIYGNFSTDKVLIDFSGKDSEGNHPSPTTNVTLTEEPEDQYSNVQGASIENIRLRGTTNVLTGIRLVHAPGCHIDNCEVWAGKYGIVCQFSWGCSIRNVNILVGDVGLALTHSVNNIQVDNAYITCGEGMASTPYFYYTLDQGPDNVSLNPTPNLTQSTGVYTYYSSGVFNNLITEGSDIGVNFRNSGFTLNTPYAESLNDYWMLAYSSRIIANSWTGGGIGNATKGQYTSVGNLMYCCAGANIDFSINRESEDDFSEYFQYYNDTLGVPAKVLIKETTKGSTHNNYKNVKYQWERQNGQVKFLSSANNSTDVNTLDDYEEGTWTPIIRRNGTQEAWTTSSEKGTYTKIGDTVFITVNLVWTAKQAVLTEYAYLTGLPFTPSATTEWVVATVLGGGTDMYHLSLTTSGFGQFYKNQAAGASGPLIASELGAATGTLSVSFTYKI